MARKSRRRSRPAEVFLSHSSADRKPTLDLADVLRRHGIRVWYSEKHIRGATQWHDEIGTALARCDWLCLVLTPNAVRSRWVKRELLYALQHDQYEDRVVPIILKACDPEELSWVLTGLQMIRFARRFDAGCRELLALWGVEYES